MAIEVGDKAPDFTLKDTDGNDFHLYDAIKDGPVLVNFYIGDFGINCTMYMNKFIERYDEFTALGVRMFAVNDNSMDSHKMFRDRMGAPYQMLFDEGKKVATQYGAIVGPGHMVSGFTNREFYLVDKEGIVRYKWRSSIPKELPEPDIILDGVKKAL